MTARRFPSQAPGLAMLVGIRISIDFAKFGEANPSVGIHPPSSRLSMLYRPNTRPLCPETALVATLSCYSNTLKKMVSCSRASVRLSVATA